MKLTIHAGWLTAMATLFAGSPCSAEAPKLIATRVFNLSSQRIVAFTLLGLPFQDVGLEADTGDTLTPDFGVDGLFDYELYWRLRDGSVHGAQVDLRTELPDLFDGNVAISIHDDHVAVSWFRLDPAWVEYSRVGDPKILPPPVGGLRYSTCEGEILSDPVALTSWRSHAEAVRRRFAGTGEADREVAEGRCVMSWYIAPAAGRERKQLDGDTARKLRAKWVADMEAYKAGKLPAVP